MDKVRFGLIGCGNIAKLHLGYLDKLDNVTLTAVAEPVAAAQATVQEQFGERYDFKFFDDPIEMMASGLIDAILIATPHYFHPDLAIAGFEHGLHVLCEKPAAVTAADAQRMNEAHAKHPELVFAMMFNQRTKPLWRKVKELVAGGELGRIQRVTWIITNWYRTQAYYDSGSWRGTWAGEGGGVLLNQCPHNLDLIQWIAGLPQRVTAIAGIGKYHRIEVEDEITAMLEYENGAVGTFVTTTGEAPGANRLEIVGDKATLLTHGGSTIEVTRTEVPVSEHLKTSAEGFGAPGNTREVLEVEGGEQEHKAITRNFVNTILGKEKLVAPGEDGIRSLELGNAMLMSGLTHKPVDLPMDRQAYVKLLDDLRRQPASAAAMVKG